MIRCRRGDVVEVDLGYLGKVRPGVVVSIAEADHERQLMVIVPITMVIRKTVWEVPFDKPRWLMDESVVNLTGIIGVSNHKTIRHLGIFPKDAMEKVSDGLYWLLGLGDSAGQAPA